MGSPKNDNMNLWIAQTVGIARCNAVGLLQGKRYHDLGTCKSQCATLLVSDGASLCGQPSHEGCPWLPMVGLPRDHVACDPWSVLMTEVLTPQDLADIDDLVLDRVAALWRAQALRGDDRALDIVEALSVEIRRRAAFQQEWLETDAPL
jgi:hypothetical protein